MSGLSSRYGPDDILTPVSLGNSSALTHVSRVLMRRPAVEPERKLLVFCDSRQDAAHQARFIRGVGGPSSASRQSGVSARCAAEEEPHDFEWLVDTLYEHEYIEEGALRKARRRTRSESRERRLDRGRAAERVRDRARGLALDWNGSDWSRCGTRDWRMACARARSFSELCAGARPDGPELAAASTVADPAERTAGTRRAVNHEALTGPDRTATTRSRRALQARQSTARSGMPVAVRPPGQKTDERRGYKLLADLECQGESDRDPEHLAAVPRREAATAESLEAVLEVASARSVPGVAAHRAARTSGGGLAGRTVDRWSSRPAARSCAARCATGSRSNAPPRGSVRRPRLSRDECVAWAVRSRKRTSTP